MVVVCVWVSGMPGDKAAAAVGIGYVVMDVEGEIHDASVEDVTGTVGLVCAADDSGKGGARLAVEETVGGKGGALEMDNETEDARGVRHGIAGKTGADDHDWRMP